MAEQETESSYKEIEKLKKLLAAPESHGTGSDQEWRQEFAPSYDVEEEPSSWFSGYDRCNIWTWTLPVIV